MASPLANIVVGGTAAAVIAAVVIVPAIGGIATWKYLLAAVGLSLFVWAGRNKR